MRQTLLAVILVATFTIWLFAFLHLPRRGSIRHSSHLSGGINQRLHAPEAQKDFVKRLHHDVLKPKSVPKEEIQNERSLTPEPPVTDKHTAADVRVHSSNPRMEAVKEAMQHSWDAYKRYAWGHDELTPLSHNWSDWKCNPRCSLGLTMIDGLDTLWVMGMKKEFYEAVDYIKNTLTFDHDVKVSVFETIIRFLGGLLSAYDLSGEKILLTRAIELTDRLLHAFGGTFPAPMVNLATGQTEWWPWTSGNLILSEVASLQLEFRALSLRSSNPIYDQKGTDILRVIQRQTIARGGLMSTMMRTNGQFSGSTVSLGAFGDSAYEYLLKLWVLDGDEMALQMFKAAKAAIKRQMLIHTTLGIGIGVLESSLLRQEVEHLTCFAGGMFAMAHYYGVGDADDLEVAEGIAAFCHAMHHTATGLPPDTATVRRPGRITAINPKYILRPETVETYFYLWRITHNETYRDWGWDLLQACNKWLKVPGGFAGILDVNSPQSALNDKMESFWLAETLKYMYLLFSDDSLISLDDYVFNTEAHPLRRKKKSS